MHEVPELRVELGAELSLLRTAFLDGTVKELCSLRGSVQALVNLGEEED